MSTRSEEEKVERGYDVMKEIKNAALGCIKLIGFESDRKKKDYFITKDGKKILRRVLEKQKMKEMMGGLFREFTGKILEAELRFTQQIFSFPSLLRTLKVKQ